MSEQTPTPTPAPAEKTVTSNNNLCRLWTFTLASLALNGIVVIVLVVALVCHLHHHRHDGFGGRGGHGGRFYGQCQWGGFGRGHGFHHFGGNFGQGQNRGRQGGFGGGGSGKFGMMRGGGSGGPGMMRGGNGFGGGMMMGGGRGQNGPPDPAKMTDMMLDRLSAKLSLTDDEKAKIKPIIQDQVTQMQKDMEAARQARQKAMEDTKTKIKALLTSDQQKQLDAMQPPGGKGPGQPATPPNSGQ